MNKLALALFTSGILLGQGTVVIQTGVMLDGKGGTLQNRQIVIEGSRIRSIDANAAGTAKPTYDLRGLTVMPGWIDTHVHLNWHMDEHGKSVSGGGSSSMWPLRMS